MRYFHVSTSATTIYNVRGVSAFDAALRCVTRLASKGGLPHGVPVTVRVHDGEAGWSERPAKHVDVTVTPTGRNLADEVAA